MNLNRNCPKCNKELTYKSITAFKNAERKNSKCRTCGTKDGHIRNNFKYKCKICNNIINIKNEHKEDLICNSCSVKLSNIQRKNSEYIRNCPVCNEQILYISMKNLEIANNKQTICIKCTNKELAKNINTQLKKSESMSGSNNPMYGKSIFNMWQEKYGNEEANKKLDNMKNKCSIASSGKNNAMYGKPAPKKSGNGWSGYYKSIYFRSLLELSYLKYLIDNNIKFKNGEKKEYKIEYILDGKNRNYFPDFYLIDTQEIIGIKPKALINSYINKEKFKVGKFKHGNKFKIITENEIKKINLNDIYELYINNDIIFDKNYEDKLINYFK